MNVFYLKQNLDNEVVKKGKVKGIAYSGAIIPFFGFYENFIVDVESLSIPKKKTAILKDHNSSLAIGHGEVAKKENTILIDGQLSKKIKEGQDVISLSEDGFDWEMSIGVYDGYVQENFSGKVNGLEVEKANVLRNGILREVSVVSLGADMNTSMNILSIPKENKKMNELKKLRKIFKLEADAEVEKIEERAEEILEEAEKAAEEVKEVKEEVDAKDAEIEKLRSEIEDLKAKLEAIKEESEASDREEEVEASIKEAGVEMAKEAIKEIASTKEKTEMFINNLKAMKFTKSVKKEFCKADDNKGGEPISNKVEELREQARLMVKEGKAKNFLEALTIINGGK